MQTSHCRIAGCNVQQTRKVLPKVRAAADLLLIKVACPKVPATSQGESLIPRLYPTLLPVFWLSNSGLCQLAMPTCSKYNLRHRAYDHPNSYPGCRGGLSHWILLYVTQ